MSKVTKADLLQWITTSTKRNVSVFEDLSDGSTLVRVCGKLFPNFVSSTFRTAHAARSEHDKSLYWETIFNALKQSGIPTNLIDKAGIQKGRFRASYNALVLFFFLESLTTSIDFTVDFEYPINNNIASFLQSNQSVEALVKGGSLSITRDLASSTGFVLSSTSQQSSLSECPSSNNGDLEVDELKEENAQLRRDIKELQSKIGGVDPSTLMEIEVENKSLKAEIERLEDTVSKLSNTNQSLLIEIEECREASNNQALQVNEPLLETNFDDIYHQLNQLLAQPEIVMIIKGIETDFSGLVNYNRLLRFSEINQSSLINDLQERLKTQSRDHSIELERLKSSYTKEMTSQKLSLSNQNSFLQTKLELAWQELAYSQEELSGYIKHRDSTVIRCIESQQEYVNQLRNSLRKVVSKVNFFKLREGIWNNLLKSQQLLIDKLSSSIPLNIKEAENVKIKELKKEIYSLFERLNGLESVESKPEQPVIQNEGLCEKGALLSQIQTLEKELENTRSKTVAQNAIISDLKLQVKRLSLEIEEDKFETIGHLEAEKGQLLEKISELEGKLVDKEAQFSEELNQLKLENEKQRLESDSLGKKQLLEKQHDVECTIPSEEVVSDDVTE
ncbi:hypothetical protein P9112_002572 [Eukaryota sp. TZLM1-RC]